MRRFSLAAVCAAACWMSAAAAADDAFAARVAGRVLDELVKANRVPGMAASVWRDGAVVWTGTAGFADVAAGRRVTAETWFRFASVSKLFAVTAAAKLREEGRLDTAAPVSTYLPWLPKGWAGITSEHLAAHLSGLPHYQAQDSGRGGRRFATQRDAVGLFAGRALMGKPGEAYRYSSWGYTLLGAVVEAVSGMPYLDYLAAEVTPGLAIGFDATDSDNPEASVAYEIGRKGPSRESPHDYSYSLGGAALGGTAPALATWGGRVMRGEVLKPETVAWMMRPALMNDGGSAGDDGYLVGFGWRMSAGPDGTMVAHHAGSTRGARSVLVLIPEADISASVLSNASWVSAIDDTALMLAAPFAPGRAAATEACPVEAAAYAGAMGEDRAKGSAIFAMEDGVCVGRLTLDEDEALAEWLSETADAPTSAVTVIGIDPDGRLARGAMVTPIGAFDVRRAGETLTVTFSETRKLTVTLAR